MRTLPVGVQALTLAATAFGAGLVWVGLQQARGVSIEALVAALLLASLELIMIDAGDRKQERYRITLGIFGTFVGLAFYGYSCALATAVLQAIAAAIRGRPPWYKSAYNLGLTVIGTFLAGLILELAGDRGWLVAVVPLAALVNVALYTGGHALAAGVITQRQFRAVWMERYAWMALHHIILAVTGYSLGAALSSIGWLAALLATPLFLLRLNYVLHLRTERHHTADLQQLVRQLIETLAAIVDARDVYTFGHSTQVAKYAVAMAEQLGYRANELELLRRAALLHDIGKIGIPESILFKPGPLTKPEYELMKQHTLIGHRIISRIPSLAHAAEVVLQHHEWFSGQGYPRGLIGEQIMGDARIVGVADALETMISDRPYRKGRSLDEALAEVGRCNGTQFDPTVVQALFAVVRARGSRFFVNSATLISDESPSELVPGTPGEQQGLPPYDDPSSLVAASTHTTSE